MESTDRAVVRLIQPHMEQTEAGAVSWPALLDWLEKAVTEQTKRGGAGSGGTGSPIDLGALELLKRIEHGVKNIREVLFAPVQRDLKTAVFDTWERAKQFRNRGELNDTDWLMITDAFPDWVNLIEAEWGERTRTMEVTVECPKCEHRWVLADDNGEDKRRSAIVIEYGEGRAPVAECRVAGCGGFWVGWADVTRLGFSLGATQDLVVLAACGINIEETIAR